MDAHGGWKLEVDSRGVDYGLDLEGADELWKQILGGGFQGNVLGCQPNLLTRCVVWGVISQVVVAS